ncbi:hypothetical protein BJ165DRAFT_604527 [Panaeolus papilionaceus]|nr:hypothetical protein BJ165DRAFT_604527 [Panaeolus papilionaceus]
MEGIRSSFAALEKAVKADAKKCATLEKDLMHLSSISRLLSLSAVPASTKTRLSNLFRKTLCLFYPNFLSHALMYALSLVQYIHEDKIQSSLQSSDATDASQWQGLQAAIISGILDFIEDSEQPSSKVQITIAEKVFPKLCPLYVEKGASRALWTLDRGLAVTVG